MKLNAYLNLTKEPVAAFARSLGVAGPTVWRWLAGTRSPNADQMRAIYVATHGAVQPNDWVLVWSLGADQEADVASAAGAAVILAGFTA